VENSGCAVGVKCRDGVVLGVEKQARSALLKPGSNRRVFTVDHHAGLAYAGWDADGRPLAELAMQESISYKYVFGVPIPAHELAERLARYMHYYTCEGYLRPYGVSLLVAAYDERDKQAHLHMIDPSGVQFRYRGCSAGKSRPAVKTELEKLNFDTITCREALRELARIARLVHEEDTANAFEFEASWVCEESGWKHEVVPLALRQEADAWARRRLAEEEGLMEEVAP